MDTKTRTCIQVTTLNLSSKQIIYLDTYMNTNGMHFPFTKKGQNMWHRKKIFDVSIFFLTVNSQPVNFF